METNFHNLVDSKTGLLGILLITVQVFQVPLPFYADKQLSLSEIQWSPAIRKQGWNFSQLWNPYTINLKNWGIYKLNSVIIAHVLWILASQK